MKEQLSLTDTGNVGAGIEPNPPKRESLPTLHDSCAQINESELRHTLSSVFRQNAGEKGFEEEVESIVRFAWLDYNMEEALLKAAEFSVSEVSKEYSTMECILYSWSKEKTGEMAQKTVEKAFSSEYFLLPMQEMTNNISEETGKIVSRAIDHSMEKTLLCMRTYLGHHYSDTIASVFGDKVESVFIYQKILPELSPEVHAPLGGKTATGIGIIVSGYITRQVTRKIVARIGRRIAGKVASRIAGRIATTAIPIAGWIAGGTMIAWDIYDSKEGPFPAIQKQITSHTTREEIRTLISRAVVEELRKGIRQGADTISDRLIILWQDFRSKYQVVLSLAKTHEEFRRILEDTEPEAFYRLGHLVMDVSREMGRESLLDSIASGDFSRALALPEPAYDILFFTKSFQTLFLWAEKCGKDISRVVSFEIYKNISPKDYTSRELKILLSLRKKETAQKITLLEKKAVKNLLQVSAINLSYLAERQSPRELVVFSGNLEAFDNDCDNLLVSYALSGSSGMDLLRKDGVRKILLKTEYPVQSLHFLFGERDFAQILKDARVIIRGKVKPMLFVYKYSVSTVILLAAGFAGLLYVLGRQAKSLARRK